MVRPLELVGLVYLATGLVEVLFLRFALANRERPGSLGFGMMVVGISIWATSSGFGVFFPSLGVSVLAFDVQLFGASLAFVGWFLLALEFTHPERLTRRVRYASGGFIAFWTLAIWTNPLHDLMWRDPVVQQGAVLLEYGSAWWPYIGTHYLLLLVALGLLLREFVATSGAKRMQAGAFALATLPVFATTVVTIFNVGVGNYDVTPFGYLVVFPILAWALYRARFLEVLPVARKTVVEEMQDAVVILDEDDQVADFNAAAADLLDLDGSTIGDRGAAVFARYGDTARQFADTENVETEVTVDDDGTDRHLHLNISPLGGATTTGGGRVVVLREITTLKRREAELRERERQFDLLRQVLSRVLRHNLRNDLQVIRARANSIPEADDARVDELVDIVVGKADDLAHTGENARRLERVIDSEGTPVEVDVAAVVTPVVEQARETYRGATIELDCPEWAHAVADSHLVMAVEDLVENAVVHADDPEPSVAVTVECTDEAVVLEVADDGPGIPDEELSVLASGGETDLHHGSGAGLWMVTWIVERSEGELTFETSSGGTTVTVQLPRADAAAVATSPGTGVDEVTAGSASDTTT